MFIRIYKNRFKICEVKVFVFAKILILLKVLENRIIVTNSKNEKTTLFRYLKAHLI